MSNNDLISRKAVKRQFGSLWLKHRLAATIYMRETGDFKTCSKTIAEVIDEVPAADVPREMSAREYGRMREQICHQYQDECWDCPFYYSKYCHFDDIDDRTISKVEKWAQEHPERSDDNGEM